MNWNANKIAQYNGINYDMCKIWVQDLPENREAMLHLQFYGQQDFSSLLPTNLNQMTLYDKLETSQLMGFLLEKCQWESQAGVDEDAIALEG